MLCMPLTKKRRKEEEEEEAIFKRRIALLALNSDLSLTRVPSVERKRLTMKTFKRDWKLCPTGRRSAMT